MPISMEAESRDGQGPQTRCSTCRTVFQVSADLLHSADTRVRCGECYAIFDALANLVEHGGAVSDRGGERSGGAPHGTPTGRAADGTSLADLANDTSALDVTYSDFDLFSEDAELPEVAWLDRTRDVPELDFDSVEEGRDETFSDTLFAADMTQQVGSPLPQPGANDPGPVPAAADAAMLPLPPDPEGGGQAGGVRAPFDFRYRDPVPGSAESRRVSGASGVADTSAVAGTAETVDAVVPVDQAVEPTPAPDGHPALGALPAARSWRLPVLLALGLAVLVAGLYVHRQRGALHEDPLIRPAYELVCRITGCEVPLRRAPDRISLIERQMYSHPTLDGALVIDLVFRNDASFVQASPALSVRLSDPSGQVVARRTFQPGEYLDDPGGDAQMAPGERVSVGLDVEDPGSDASSFVIDFVPASGVPQAVPARSVDGAGGATGGR